MTEDRGVVIVSHAEQQIRDGAEAVWLDGETVAAAGAPDEVFQKYNQAERK